MADRKRTPDVLAELLSPDLPPAELPKAPAQPVQKSQAPREPKPRPQPAPEAWEVEIVSFQDHRGWRPRFVNGVELKDWLTGVLVHDYVNQRGSEGWELTGGTAKDRFYGSADGLQLYFKRRKS